MGIGTQKENELDLIQTGRALAGSTNQFSQLKRRFFIGGASAMALVGVGCSAAPAIVTTVQDKPSPSAVATQSTSAGKDYVSHSSGKAAAKAKPRLGLALGGGAARGFAHVGVISVLESVGIVPDIIVGTSAGSLVGALYASGLNSAALKAQSLALDESILGDWTLSVRSVVKGQALQDYINRLVGNRKIEQFPRRFAATATDLYNGQLRLFVSGNCGLAVRASSSVPAVFEPVTFEGREYVDGGLVSPIPVNSTRRLGCDVVIGVDISARPSFQSTETIPQVLLQTFAIMGQKLAEGELREADFQIRPNVSDLSATSFDARRRSIEEGEKAMRAQLPALMARLAL